MNTTLFLSVSIDGFIADKQGIPLFPEGAWEDWCALVNATGNVIAGRSSFEQLQGDPMGAALHPRHKIVLSTQDIDTADSGWTQAGSPAEALKILEDAGVEEAMIGGGRAIACSFMREQLVDHIVVDLQPVAFGTGVPVFGDDVEVSALKLLESQPLNEDAIRLRYQVLRHEQ